MNFAGVDVRNGRCGIASASEDSRLMKLIELIKIEDAPVVSPIQLFRKLCLYLQRRFPVEPRDCVVSIPSYFNEKQRRKLLDSAKNSGRNVLRLMHECTAIALSYGFYKHFAPDNQSIVAFVYIEASDIQISIARFRLGKMEILSHASDSSLGVNIFDEVLFNYFSSQFKENHKIASERLKFECRKVRNDLRENTETSFQINHLIGSISREKFDHLCLESLIRIATVCSQAIADAEVPLEGIDAVELIGLGSMLTSIPKVIHSVFHKEPNCSLIASESIAKGCALQCALLSANSVAINYEIIDALPFSIRVSPNEDAVFKRNSPFPVIDLINKQTVSSFCWENFEQIIDTRGYFDKFKQSTPWEYLSVGSKKTNIQYKLDINGIISSEDEKAYPFFFLQKEVTTKNDENVDADGDYSMKEANAVCHIPLLKDRETMVKHKATITESIYSAMNEADVASAFKRENDLLKNDQKVEEAKNCKNLLESYLYDTRNKLNKMYAKFVDKQTKDNITKKLQETERWIYGEGSDETKDVYISKLDELKNMVKPIVKRYGEEEERQQLQSQLKFRLNCHVLSAQHMYHDFINAENHLNLPGILSYDEINQISEWLDGRWNFYKEKADSGFFR